MSKITNNSNTSHTSNHNHHHHHHSSSSSSSRTSSSTTQACAACKYQRRRCNPDCQLAPYFPADHQRQFLNAHRLYGVSNILKILKKLDPCYHAEAMRTIIYESDTRAQFPVGGCYQVILDMNRFCEHLMNELAITVHHLELHRAQQALVMQQSDDIYGNDVMAAQAQQAQQQQQQQQQQCFDYFCFDGNNDDVNGLNVNIGNGNGNGNESEIKGTDSGSVGNNYNAGNGGEVDVDFFNLQQQQQNNNGNVVVDDVKPLIDVFDITNALDIVDEDVGEITSKVADIDIVTGSASYQCSSEEPRKDEVNSMGQILQEHDLKGAASLFTLTSRDSSYV